MQIYTFDCLLPSVADRFFCWRQFQFIETSLLVTFHSCVILCTVLHLCTSTSNGSLFRWSSFKATEKSLKVGQIFVLYSASKREGFQLQGGLPPLTPDQGLCSWTPLGAPPPDPRYRLALRALAPFVGFLDPPLEVCAFEPSDKYRNSRSSLDGKRQKQPNRALCDICYYDVYSQCFVKRGLISALRVWVDDDTRGGEGILIVSAWGTANRWRLLCWLVPCWLVYCDPAYAILLGHPER